MLTGHDSDADTILGLDAGANDYVTKPFKFPVLLARIRAQLRQHEQSEDAVFQLARTPSSPRRRCCWTRRRRRIRLTEKETNILKFLYRAQSGVVARDILLHEVWAITLVSPPIRWKPTSTACARRSSPIRATRAFW